MSKHKSDVRKQIWKQMWIAALLLYVSYFFYRWVGVYTAGVIGEITDGLLYQSEFAARGKLLGKLTVAFALSLLIMPAIDLLTNVLVFRRGLRYESTVIRSVIEKKYETVKSWQAGEWLGRISKDSLQYRQVAVITPTRIAADATVLLVAVITMVRTNLLLAVLSVAGLVFSTTVQMVAKKKSEFYLEENRKYQDSKRSLQVEMARGHDFLRMLGCEKAFSNRMRICHHNFWSSILKKDLSFGASVNTVQQFIVSAVFVGSLFLSLSQVQNDTFSTGDFISIYFISAQIQTLMSSLLNNFQIMRGYQAQENRIKELVATEEEGGVLDVPSWEKLHFENVSYTYPSTPGGMPERSFSIHRKERFQLEGRNGSGKTTLLNMLCGLFSSRNDSVMLDDVPLSAIDLTKWREKIGYMQQFPDLFPGTVRENVRIGNLAASETQVDAALGKVGLLAHAERILSGKKEELSGGEIKRLSLARVLMRLEKCELLILDEPIENLDEAGKELISELLNNDKRAQVYVCHRV